MQKKYLFLNAFLGFILWGSVQLRGQSIPVGTAVLEDAYRRAQLLGNLDSTISFTSRPFFPSVNQLQIDAFDPDSTLKHNRWTKFDGTLRFGKNKGIIKLLPVTWVQQFNSNHPAGFNDGAMIPARGYQTIFSTGIYIQYGPLSIQLRPEKVYAENKVFPTIPNNPPGESYNSYLKGIDLPERFGDNAYNKLLWGQSSIRLTVGPVSLGLSNENLWWGPGIWNSLLMSDNAPGFKHLTLNTVKPVRTPIGSFEGQIIAGRLERSAYSTSLINDWRYLNGIVFTYQPKWVPGLFLGVTRSFVSYSKDMGKTLNDYLPVITPVTKKTDGGNSEDTKKRDQLASFFMRWLWIEEHGEIYFEFGKEDHAWNLRDFLLQTSYSGAYTLGLEKLFPLKGRKDEYVQIKMEITQLGSNSSSITRSETSKWYTHSDIKEGYTNLGKIIGAGIGPGSNLQTLNVSWGKSLKKIGIQFDRLAHNIDFQYDVINDVRNNWVDLSASIITEWNYKNLLFNANFGFIQEKNFEWEYKPKLTIPQQYWNQTRDSFNFHGQLGITYRF